MDPADGRMGRLARSKAEAAEALRLPPRRPAVLGRPRLPPGQHEVTGKPVLDLGTRPAIDPASWRLAVDGTVTRPLGLGLADLSSMGPVRRISDIHCVTSWSRLGNIWEGVDLSAVVEAAGPSGEADHAVLWGADGYSTSLPLTDLVAEGAMLATSWDGEPLTAEHGAPARAVVPRLYFWKSAKWLVRIELTVGERPGFWERAGYHGRGEPWAEERYRGSELRRETAPGAASAARAAARRERGSPAAPFFDGEF
jgi:DMSO/TMAO reductase YedYZ molybdopterin-dependent catalytic subunit